MNVRRARWFAALAVVAVILTGASVLAWPHDEEEAPEADPPAPAAPSPPPPDHLRRPSDVRGLHYTAEELAVWRARADYGPYRTEGDAGQNAPGDWERITGNAADFLDDPWAGHWEGPPGSGCVQPDSENPPPDAETSALRDAAFYYLITQDGEYRDAVRAELLDQAAEPGLDFADSERWCPGEIYDVAPSPSMAHWLTKLLFAYDYLGEQSFSRAEREQLNTWFRDAAGFLQVDVDDALAANFANRDSGDYQLSHTRAEDLGCDGRIAYYGSGEVCAIARHYNNRRAAQVRFVGLVGIHQDVDSFKDSARLFVEEFLKFSVYPAGYYGEFERWRESLPDLGWAYANNTAGAVITIADHFARDGDPSLYEFSTEEGRDGSEGGRKDLRFAVAILGRYLDGTYERYATDDPAQVGDEDYRIDGQHSPSGWSSAHDVLLTPSNVYLRDPYIRGTYTRTGEGMPPYPEDPAPNGPHRVWTGEAGIYPGVLFMFGQMEGRVWPY